MKSNTYEEMKRLAVNLGYAQTKEEVPGEDTADVLSFINDNLEKKNEGSQDNENTDAGNHANDDLE